MGLLIHSLYEFRELIFQAFTEAHTKTVVEVGSESGSFTAELLEWVALRNGHLTTVDPTLLNFNQEKLALFGGHHTFLQARSPMALRDIPAADAYLLDGDHNYWTVREELEVIQAASAHTLPLIILHDVDWPCARRDMYYSPELLPQDSVHPYTYERGVVIGNSATVVGGFRGEGAFAWALHEGGPRNGVLTAVEDFLSDHQDYDLMIVPAVFGLGVLIPLTHPRRDAIFAVFKPYHQNPLLARLEKNRLLNYLNVILLQDQRLGD